MASNGIWGGPERRRSSAEERARYALEHQGSRAVLLRYFTRMPRPVLAAIALLGAGYVAQAEIGWRSGIDTHVAAAQDGYARLAAVERLAADTRDEIRLLRQGQEQQRLDQLEFYRWFTQHQLGDAAKAKELDRKVKDLSRPATEVR